jgi:hypothetical protein
MALRNEDLDFEDQALVDARARELVAAGSHPDARRELG